MVLEIKIDKKNSFYHRGLFSATNLAFELLKRIKFQYLLDPGYIQHFSDISPDDKMVCN